MESTDAAVPAVPTEDVTAPVADQPDVPVTAAPEAIPAGTSTETASPATPDAEAPETDAESFTGVDAENLPEDVAARYQQMQADYTRKTQALAERHQELDQALTFVGDLVSDESNDTQKAVFRVLAERLGYDIQGDDEATEGETPDTEPLEGETPEFRDPRLDPILAERDAKAQADADAAYEQQLNEAEKTIDEGIAGAAKADGITLTEAESDIVFDLVLALPAKDGGPDVKGAYDRYKAATQADRERWVKSKTASGVPGGGAAEEPVDLKNEESRQRHMANIIEAHRRAEAGL